MNPPLLENGKYYHIYNHGVGNRNLFNNKSHYERFLQLYEKYIEPIAETFAWVLMPNHFHCLVRIKENVVYKYNEEDFRLMQQQISNQQQPPQLQFQPDRSKDAVRLLELQKLLQYGVVFNDVKWQTIEISKYNSNLSAPTGSDRLELLKENKIKAPVPHLHFSHLFNAYGRYFNKNCETRGTLFERPFRRKPVDNEYYLKTLVLYIHNNSVRHGFCSHTIEYPWSSYFDFFSDNSTIIRRKDVLEWFGTIENFKLMHNMNSDDDEIDNWLEL
ncbi:MAG: hypothetical protein JXR36_06590 [Bacteroidales bacterium]|nr:hypothetical protein [Bacteroidales bacterium]